MLERSIFSRKNKRVTFCEYTISYHQEGCNSYGEGHMFLEDSHPSPAAMVTIFKLFGAGAAVVTQNIITHCQEFSDIETFACTRDN